MKLVSITLSLLALAAGAHAGNPSMDDVIQELHNTHSPEVGHAMRFYHGNIGSLANSGSGSHSELHVRGDDEDTIVFPTPKPTHFASVEDFRAHHGLGGSSAATHSMEGSVGCDDTVAFPTPEPTVSNADAQWQADWMPTPLPTEPTDIASDSSSFEQLALAAEVANSAVGEAYAVTREEVEARSSYVVPVAVAGCIAAVVGIAAIVVVMQKRKRARKAIGGEVDYSNEIVTPV